MNNLIQQVIKEKASNHNWWKESEQTVISRYGTLFSPKNLDNLTKEEFKSFLLIKNNLHWEGIHRSGNIITSDMKALKRFLKHALDENLPLEVRLNTEFIEDGGLWVKGIGRAVITAILLVVYPHKYGVWNTKSEMALKNMSLYPDLKNKKKFGDKYKKINEVLIELANENNITLWQLDGILGDISGASPFTNIEKNSDEELVQDLEAHGIQDPVNFVMEKHLEEFLITNWNKTIFGKKYNLIFSEEKELLSQQYRTEIGLIDILAESKDGKEYLIIELKKNKSTDAVVGQTLRYITWVKRHLAKGKEVKGIIVVLEAEDKLKYSLSDQKNIELFTYVVNFNLEKQKIIE